MTILEFLSFKPKVCMGVLVRPNFHEITQATHHFRSFKPWVWLANLISSFRNPHDLPSQFIFDPNQKDEIDFAKKKTCKIEPSLLTSNSCVLPMDLFGGNTPSFTGVFFAPSFLQVNSSIYFQVPFIPRSQNPVTSGLVRVVVPQTCDHQPPKNKRI